MTTYAKLKQEGKIEGKIEGRKEGKIEGKIEVVLKSYESGLSISLIANITGLTEEEVYKILKEHGKIS